MGLDPGLDPGVHRIKRFHAKKMDCRIKPGNDDRIVASKRTKHGLVHPARAGLSKVGSRTILPATSPDSTSRWASAARDSGRSFSIWALIFPSAAAAKHFGMSASLWPVRPMIVIFL